MDAATFYIIVVFIITLVIVSVGVYLILILHETHRSLRRINNILDHFESLASFLETKVVRPTAGFVSVVSVLKEGLEFFNEFKASLNSRKTSSEREQNF